MKNKITALKEAWTAHKTRFACDEGGMELIQVVIIIIMALVVAGAVWAIVNKVTDKMEANADEVEGWNWNIGGDH